MASKKMIFYSIFFHFVPQWDEIFQKSCPIPSHPTRFFEFLSHPIMGWDIPRKMGWDVPFAEHWRVLILYPDLSY